jgi:hypothetical protein
MTIRKFSANYSDWVVLVFVKSKPKRPKSYLAFLALNVILTKIAASYPAYNEAATAMRERNG